MTEIHALSGAYAVDAVDDIERARFEKHLAGCADCRAEVASLREAAGLLSDAYAVAAPADMRARVLQEIGTVRPLPPVLARAQVRARRFPARLLVAAAVLLVAAAGVGALHPWTSSPQTSLSQEVMTASDAIHHEVDLRGGGTVTVVDSAHLGRAVVVTHDLPAAPAGKTYELWLQDRTGTMRPAGLVSGGNRTVVMRGNAARAIGAGVTVEPAGGSRRPTSAPIALVHFKDA